MVRGTGLEPAWCYPPAPQAGASTNFATRAQTRDTKSHVRLNHKRHFDEVQIFSIEDWPPVNVLRVYDQKRGSQVRSPEGFQMDTKPGSIVLRPTLWRILSQNSLTGIEDRNVVRIRERQARSTPAMDCKGGTSEANSPREIWKKRRWIGGGVESGAQGIGAAHRGTRRAGGPSQG